MRNTLYVGKRGLYMLEDALAKAKEILGRDNLAESLDFLKVDVSDDKKSIGVEEVSRVLEFASKAAVSGNKVVIFTDFDTVTVQAQNKLLKTFEESDVTFLCISYSDGQKVLPTIRSRMHTIVYNRYTLERFAEKTGLTGDELEVCYMATDGCPGLCEQIHGIKDNLMAAGEALKEGGLKRYLASFSELKEKDKEAFSKDLSKAEFSLSYLEGLALKEEKDSSIVTRCEEERRLLRSIGYTATYFFTFLMDYYMGFTKIEKEEKTYGTV